MGWNVGDTDKKQKERLRDIIKREEGGRRE